jgi:ribose transport system permease protein
VKAATFSRTPFQIVLLNSVLSIMAMPEAGRQVIYRLVIILMLLVYGRGERVTS